MIRLFSLLALTTLVFSLPAHADEQREVTRESREVPLQSTDTPAVLQGIIRANLTACWKPNADVWRGMKDAAVHVLIEYDQQGVARDVSLLADDEARYKKDAAFRRAALEVLQTAAACQLKDPPPPAGTYTLWKKVEYTFDPAPFFTANGQTPTTLPGGAEGAIGADLGVQPVQ